MFFVKLLIIYFFLFIFFKYLKVLLNYRFFSNLIIDCIIYLQLFVVFIEYFLIVLVSNFVFCGFIFIVYTNWHDFLYTFVNF
jgi:hypothetical protein